MNRLLAALIISMICTLPVLAQQVPTQAEVQQQIQNLQTKTNGWERANAALRLGELGGNDAGAALAAALRKDDDADAVRVCAEALLKLNYRPAVPDLLQALKKFPYDMNATPAIMNALIAFADPAMKEQMLELTTHPFTAVLALDALETLHDPSIGARIIPLLQQRDGVACRAALLAGRLGLHDAAPRIRALLNDSNPQIRLAAAQALALLKDPAAIAPLTQFCTDADPALRLAAVDALAACQQPPLADAFTPLLHDKDAGVRAHALAWAAGNAAAVPELLQALQR